MERNSENSEAQPADADGQPLETEAERRRRRAVFLRELAEARELRARVQPRKTKERRMREALRMRTFRI
jgi:hypothetical protein